MDSPGKKQANFSEELSQSDETFVTRMSQDYTTRNSITRPNDSGKAPPFSLVVSTPPSVVAVKGRHSKNIPIHHSHHFEQIITRIAAKNGYFTDESSLNLHILPNIIYESAMPNGNLPGRYSLIWAI